MTKFVIRNTRNSLRHDAVVGDVEHICEVISVDEHSGYYKLRNVYGSDQSIFEIHPYGIAFKFETLQEAEALCKEYQNLLALRREHAKLDKAAKNALMKSMSQYRMEHK